MAPMSHPSVRGPSRRAMTRDSAVRSLARAPLQNFVAFTVVTLAASWLVAAGVFHAARLIRGEGASSDGLEGFLSWYGSVARESLASTDASALISTLTVVSVTLALAVIFASGTRRSLRHALALLNTVVAWSCLISAGALWQLGFLSWWPAPHGTTPSHPASWWNGTIGALGAVLCCAVAATIRPLPDQLDATIQRARDRIERASDARARYEGARQTASVRNVAKRLRSARERWVAGLRVAVRSIASVVKDWPWVVAVIAALLVASSWLVGGAVDSRDLPATGPYPNHLTPALAFGVAWGALTMPFAFLTVGSWAERTAGYRSGWSGPFLWWAFSLVVGVNVALLGSPSPSQPQARWLIVAAGISASLAPLSWPIARLTRSGRRVAATALHRVETVERRGLALLTAELSEDAAPHARDRPPPPTTPSPTSNSNRT